MYEASSKYLKLNGLQVLERARFCDAQRHGQTDGRTGKTNCLPILTNIRCYGFFI